MAKPKTDVWQFQVILSERLMRWAGFSIGTGAQWAARKDSCRRGMGAQFVGWGLVNAALAWFGLHDAQQKSTAEDAHTTEAQTQARQRLCRLLWINTGLDVLYISGGAYLARRKGKHNAFWRGTAWGILLQGAFLLGFDALHALQLTEVDDV